MRAIFLTLLMVSASLAGCFGEEEVQEVPEIRTVWDFERPELTWYHFADEVDAWGNNEFDVIQFESTVVVVLVGSSNVVV